MLHGKIAEDRRSKVCRDATLPCSNLRERGGPISHVTLGFAFRHSTDFV